MASETPTKESSPLLDLAFAMDCTGSMGSYIKQAQANIRKIVEEIFSKETKDVRLALVQYRDHPPQDTTFVTLVNDFTPSVGKMKSWLDTCSASGGGDTPEAVADALHQVLKLSWRPDATKMCVFIADAPPHGISPSGDSFPNGCPDGLDPMVTTQQLATLGVALYVVGCEPSITPYKSFFEALCHLTGGQYVPLVKASYLSAVIIGGAREEISLDRYQEDVREEIESAILETGEADIDVDMLTRQVQSKLKTKGAKATQLRRGANALPQASSYVADLSSACNISEYREKASSVQSAPLAMSTMPLSDCMDEYATVEQDIDFAQANRMVNKMLSKRK